jgi:FG-GAP repeat protein
MFNLDIKINEKKRVLSTILAVIILFPLLSFVPSTTITTYAEVASKDEDSSSNVTSLDTITLGKIKKNITDMMNQDNNSDKMTNIESTINDTIISKNIDKNEISFPFNITGTIGSTSTSSSSSNAATQASEVTADFNGDGFEDKAIGVPSEHIGSIVYAGLVHVIYGSSAGLSATAVLPDQFWTQGSFGLPDIVEDHDSFGYVLSAGDYNNDGRDDLSIGVPGEDIRNGPNAGDIQQNVGLVHVIYGSSGGLSATAVLPNQLWSQDSPGIEDVAEDGDFFGFSLSSGDYNGDKSDDLAVGVWREDIDAIDAPGAVQVIYGSSPAGLSATAALPDQFWTQDSPGIEDVAETVDFFSVSLSSGDYNGDGNDDLAVGASREDIGPIGDEDSGAVHIIYGSSPAGLSATAVLPDQLWTQNSIDIEDVAEAGNSFGRSLSSGDYNGDGNDDLAVGVPYEEIGSIDSAGAVHIIYGSSPAGLSATAVLPDQFWTQDSPGIEDFAEANNQFGRYLSSGDYNGDKSDDLAVGVKSEGIGSIVNAGVVHIIYGSSPAGLSATAVLPDQLWSQDSPGIDDVAEADDNFGGVSSGDYNGDGFDDLAIGVHGEDFLGVIPGPGGVFDTIVNAGVVHIIYGSSPAGLSATAVLPDQLWSQDSPGIDDIAETDDAFGSSL